MRVVIAPFNRMNDTTLAAVRAAGHEVICTGRERLSYPEIAALYPSGWQPDVFLFWSPEYHPIPRGLESAPCLKVGVYGDWNLGGQAIQQSAATFDLVFADANGADRLRGLGFSSVEAAQLWSFDPDLHRRLPKVERDIDILLVGNFNHDIQRDRCRWLGRVAQQSSRYKVLLAAGIYGEAYVQLLNRARIVFNRSIRGEINMRAYEAPACGALLFQERENREIRSLFADKQDCVLYGDDDLEHLLEHYLSQEDERAAIAEAGCRRVQRETPALHILAMFHAIEARLTAVHCNVGGNYAEPDAELRRARQWLLGSDLGCLGAADEALRRAERAGANPAEVAGLRGYVLAQAGQYLPGIDRKQAWTEALQQWESAANVRPKCASHRLNLASLLMEAGQAGCPIGMSLSGPVVDDVDTSRICRAEGTSWRDEAEQQARMALELLFDENAEAIEPGALYWPCRFTAFGVEYDRIEIGHKHCTEGWFREMRSLLQWRAFEIVGEVAFQSARFAVAARFAAEAVALMPQIATTQFRLARALNALGRLEEAAEGYREAVAINPFLAEAHGALVQCLLDNGRHADALAELADWAAIVAGCPSCAPQLAEFNRLQALARQALQRQPIGDRAQPLNPRAYRDAADHSANGGVTDQSFEPATPRRLLAFPDWRDEAAWQNLVTAFALPRHDSSANLPANVRMNDEGALHAHRTRLAERTVVRKAADNTAAETSSYPSYPSYAPYVPAVDGKTANAAGDTGMGTDLLMLWADPAEEEPAALLRKIAGHLTVRLRLLPSEFPNVTIVSHAFAPFDRWKLFHAASAVVDTGPIPEQFREVLDASRLQVLPMSDLRFRAA